MTAGDLTVTKFHHHASGRLWFLIPLMTVVLVGCGKSGPTPNTTSGNQPRHFETHFQDESQFIVESITTDLAEQMIFAKTGRMPEPGSCSVEALEKQGSPFGAPEYQLRIKWDPKQKPLELVLKIGGAIWDPAAYETMTATLGAKMGLTAKSSEKAAESSLLAELTDGKASTIEIENDKISNDLEKDFCSASLHEQAAVILGAFALREHSQCFYDIRAPLCRLTAHLAMARFLRGASSPSAVFQVAEATLWTLFNDQLAALEKIGNLPQSDKAAAIWKRTLEAHVTADYRAVTNAEDVAVLERVAWFESFSRSANAEVAWARAGKLKEQVPDFCRIAQEVGYSVETSHDLYRLSIPLEMKEIAQIFELAKNRKLQGLELVDALNDLPERCFSKGDTGMLKIRVISWGQWAAFFQRHLCHTLVHNFNMLQNKWGLPEDAAAFTKKVNSSFAGLRSFPFVRLRNSIEKEAFLNGVNDALPLTRKSPHLVSAYCWNYLTYKPPFFPDFHGDPNLPLEEWHKHNPPPGTAYDVKPRLDHPNLGAGPNSQERVTKLHEIAPYDLNITLVLIDMQYRNGFSPDQARALYGRLLPYSSYAMEVLGNTLRDKPEEYEKQLVKTAAVNPSVYYSLGDYFVDKRQDDKAAGYLEKAEALDLDSLQAASRASWRIRYYLQKGQTEKARRIADAAGEVYSAAGLKAKAEFHELRGEYETAFEWYSKVQERYNDSGPVIEFVLRYKAKTGNKRFDSVLQAQASEVFPKGMQKVTLKDFSSPPQDGVLIPEENNLTAQAGLKQGAVVVALNGIRVHGFQQYSHVRAATASPVLNLIVWQDGQYREIKASPPDKRFGISMPDYSAR